jgi:Protein of unknown function (DUF4031)
MNAAGIYVDQLAPTPRSARWRWDSACHLFHEFHDLAALDAFALSIGLRREWRHDAPGFPHYDLHVRHRALAIAAGAVEVDRHHPVMRAMFDRRREFLRTQGPQK